MKSFYTITEKIESELLKDPNVKTVTMGDITRIDLNKQTIFPLSHMIVNQVTNENNILRFNISILSMDIVNISKDKISDIFRGNDNEQDILNTQLFVQNKLVQSLRMGDIRSDGYEVDGTPNFEPFLDRFENEMAGWVLTLDIIMSNDISIC